MQRKIIFFELNEVPLRIVEHFCNMRPESTLARLWPICRKYETYTEDVGHLSPWITWPSVHRGVPDEKHFIQNFGQELSDVNQEYPAVWELLRQQQVSVGVCGSLHTYPLPNRVEEYAFFIPDTFAAGSECFPKSVEAYQRFNLTMARESARNVVSHVPWRESLRFLASAPGLGFKMSTAVELGQQIISERLANWKKIRRRTYQSVIAFDVFMRQLELTRPDFSTFFTNHVASSLHRYWAALFPDDYDIFEFEPEWVKTYRNEIDFTLSKADIFLERLVRFADRNPDYTIWVLTSMGQAATKAQKLETQLYVLDLSCFMSAMGLEPSEWEVRPAMLPQANVKVTPSAEQSFEARLRTLTVAGKPIGYRAKPDGFFSIDFGHANLDPVKDEIRVEGKVVLPATIGCENLEIQDKSGTNAYHIPQGCLFIYDPKLPGVKQRGTQISTLDIAPTVLRNYSVPVPEYMHHPTPV